MSDFLYGILTGASGVFILSGAVLAVLIRRAPLGYETDAGFRYGPEPFDQFGRERTDALTSARSLSLHSSASSQKGQQDRA